MIKKEHIYLVTGGSGFLGKELCTHLVSKGVNVRALARDEGNLISLKQQCPEVDIYIGDIQDPFVVRQACKGVSGIFHLAASKHVGLAEKFAKESVESNVVGSINLLNESLVNDMDFIVGISTDKAAQVNGVYGATKLLMERLFLQFEKLNPSCKYRVVRYGNVLYSTGSVLCKWKEALSKGEGVIITDPNATRFFWTVDQAIQLIFDCMRNSIDATPYCPDMKAMKMGDLLDAMIAKYSKTPHPLIEEIGMQQGDNLHEKILEDGPYSNEVELFTTEEILKII